MEAVLFHEDGRTRHDEVNQSFSQFAESDYKRGTCD